MPNCFQLIRKTNPEAGPVKLGLIDDELRARFNAPPDPNQWFRYWFDNIGFASDAGGRSFATQRQNAEDSEVQALERGDVLAARVYLEIVEVIDYLDAHFTADTFYEVSGR